jgi:hypothetical protein
MALILKYRLDPPDALNQEVYAALAHQVGKVGLNINIPLDEGDPEKAVVILRGEFIAVEGEHFQPRRDDKPMFPLPKMEERGP